MKSRPNVTYLWNRSQSLELADFCVCVFDFDCDILQLIDDRVCCCTSTYNVECVCVERH